MNKIITIAIVSAAFFLAGCQDNKTDSHSDHSQKKTPVEAVTPSANVSSQVVDAGCGSCTYNVAGVEGCETWVNIDNKKLKVTGVDHNTHKSGLCKSGKHQAKVTGSIQGDKFVASSLEVVKESTGAEDHSGHDHEGHEH